MIHEGSTSAYRGWMVTHKDFISIHCAPNPPISSSASCWSKWEISLWLNRPQATSRHSNRHKHVLTSTHKLNNTINSHYPNNRLDLLLFTKSCVMLFGLPWTCQAKTGFITKHYTGLHCQYLTGFILGQGCCFHYKYHIVNTSHAKAGHTLDELKTDCDPIWVYNHPSITSLTTLN